LHPKNTRLARVVTSKDTRLARSDYVQRILV